MSARGREALDRHALVLALWLAFGLVAAALFHFGFGDGGWPWIAAGFAMVIAAFAAHVIVNAVLQTRFTEKEVALGLVVYGLGLLVYVLALLLSTEFRGARAIAAGLGFAATAAAAIFTMIAWLGVRGAFESFDVIRRAGRR